MLGLYTAVIFENPSLSDQAVGTFSLHTYCGSSLRK